MGIGAKSGDLSPWIELRFSSVFRFVVVVALIASALGVSSTAVASIYRPDASIIAAYSVDYGVSAERATESLVTQSKLAQLNVRLQQAIPDSFAGIWFDNEQGRPNVAIVDGALHSNTEILVRQIAGEVDLPESLELTGVSHSLRELDIAANEIARRSVADGSRTGVSVDVRGNSVEVSGADFGTPSSRRVDAGFETVTRRTSREIPSVNAQADCSHPDCSRPLRGGVAMRYSDRKSYCTTGFVAFGGGSIFVVTAGHCNLMSEQVYARRNSTGVNERIGPIVNRYKDAWGDSAAIIISSSGGWSTSTVSPYVSNWGGNVPLNPIWIVSDGYVGQYGCRYGRTTPYTCGVITALNATATVDGLTTYGLTHTDMCSLKGDSGGPLVAAGNVANGTLVGGNAGSCPTPTTSALSVFEPVSRIQARYGIQIAMQ